jgi:hypothetical protein
MYGGFAFIVIGLLLEDARRIDTVLRYYNILVVSLPAILVGFCFTVYGAEYIPSFFGPVGIVYHTTSAVGTHVAGTMIFKSVLKQDSEVARRCYGVVEDLLVRKGEYELCLSFIPNSEARFNTIRQEKERMAQMPFGNSRMKEFYEGHFVKQTCTLIEILVATGHKPEAEKIRDQALLVIGDPLLTSAVQDAEKKLAK